MKMARYKDDDKVIDITKLRKKKIKKQQHKDDDLDTKLYDVVDMIVKISIVLDEMGQTKYGNMLSDVVEKMFTDASLTPTDWGWEEDPE